MVYCNWVRRKKDWSSMNPFRVASTRFLLFHQIKALLLLLNTRRSYRRDRDWSRDYCDPFTEFAVQVDQCDS